MKKSKIFKKAAKLLFDGSEDLCCDAINMACGPNKKYIASAARFFHNLYDQNYLNEDYIDYTRCEDCHFFMQHTYENFKETDVIERRINAMLFCSAVARLEEKNTRRNKK